jgi:aminoglycoside phosphotransferase (APT) family kinase protein
MSSDQTSVSSTALDKPAGIRVGEEIPVDRLSAYLLENIEGLQGPIEIAQFPSGFSNLTYFINTPNKEMVLRRPPFGANIKSAHDMQREYNILSALKPLYPKVPTPILYCNDVELLGADFYVMERVNGVILRQRPPEGLSLNKEMLRAISASLADTLAELHSLDINHPVLAGLGKPEGYVQRQVNGWSERYRKAKTEEVSGMEMAMEWLVASIPVSERVALIHNDFKYDNVVLSPEDITKVIAVLDWEMATLGDPLMDLGTTLAYWAEEDSPEVLKAFSLTAFPGNMTREDFAAHYAAHTRADLSNILFYYVFGCFKVGVIVQQIYARYQKGFTQDKRFANLIYLVYACASNIEKAIQKGRISALGS